MYNAILEINEHYTLIVVFRRKKLEINPDSSSNLRSLLPPVLKIYKILQVTPLYCKVMSLNDHSVVRIAKDKLEKLSVEEYLKLNPAAVGLSKFVENMAIRGDRELPDFFDAEKIFGPNFQTVERHIKSCVSKNCPLLKKSKVYALPYSDEELFPEIFGIKRPTVQPQNLLQNVDPPPVVDIAPIEEGEGIEQLFSDFVQSPSEELDSIVDPVDDADEEETEQFSNALGSEPPLIDILDSEMAPEIIEDVIDVGTRPRPKLKVSVIQDSDASEIKDIDQGVTRFQPSKDLATRRERKQRGPPMNVARRKQKTNLTLFKCNRHYFYEKFNVLSGLKVWEIRDCLSSQNQSKSILRLKPKSAKAKKRQRGVTFNEESYLLKFYHSFTDDSQVLILKRSGTE